MTLAAAEARRMAELKAKQAEALMRQRLKEIEDQNLSKDSKQAQQAQEAIKQAEQEAREAEEWAREEAKLAEQASKRAQREAEEAQRAKAAKVLAEKEAEKAKQARESRKRVGEQASKSPEAAAIGLQAEIPASDHEHPQEGWFHTQKGERLGPLTFSELKEMADKGSLHPRLDMVWHQGMDKWIQAGRVQGLYVSHMKNTEAAQPTVPPPPPVSSTLLRKRKRAMSKFMDEPEQAPGIGRIAYLAIVIVVLIAWIVLWPIVWDPIANFMGEKLARIVAPFAPLILGAILFLLTILRIRNLGMKPLMVVLFLVPGINLWMGYRCVACPPHYALRRKLGISGILMGLAYWIVAALFALVFYSQFELLYDNYKEGEGDWHSRIQRIIGKLIGWEPKESTEEQLEEDF